MRIDTWILGLVTSVAVMTALGCSRQEPLPEDQQSSTTSMRSTSEIVLSPKELALKAKDELVKRLSSELMLAMSDGGPSAAIDVCSQKATRIAAEVSKDHGVLIGRTSFKLRNPGNKPPEWAVALIDQRTAEPHFVDLEGGLELGALLPIKLKAQCLVCHGPEEQIAKDVLDRLTSLYPDDRATGFQQGELRGWIWVQVPTDK